MAYLMILLIYNNNVQLILHKRVNYVFNFILYPLYINPQ